MYRYLTNEVVILINRIVAESSFAFRWFTFVLQFCVSLLFLQLLWDSGNDVSTSAVLSVVMPVHLVYDGTMIGAACARDDQDRFIWKFDFQTVFLTFVLSIRRCMIAHVWSYSTPRAVTSTTRMVVWHTEGCYCSQYTWLVEPQWSSTSSTLY